MTPAPVALRDARPQDSEFAYQVKRAAFRQYVERNCEWDDDEQLRLHKKRFSAGGFRIISVDAVDVGFVSVVTAPDHLKVNQLFILPQHHGGGIGRQCMLLVMQEARELNLPVRLKVMKVNPRARQFYERLAFVCVGETDTHDLMEWTPKA